jgi:hypothetical protein
MSVALEEEELREVDLTLQKAHVTIAEYESNLRQRKLSLSRR